MDTPRRQLLLQMFFFFFLGGGGVYKWKENKSSIQMTLHWDAYIQVNPGCYRAFFSADDLDC